jgi:hypothetical protein
MTKKKHLARLALAAAADGLIDELHAGKWDHVSARFKPIPNCTELIDELERRCPGHSREDRIDALARSLFTRR